jgi:hypothetical protein
MWSISKILWHDHETNQSYLILKKSKKPTKTKDSDLLRIWYKETYPDKPPDGLSRALGNLGRLNRWLKGHPSHAIEDAISNLKKGDDTPLEHEIEHPMILVRGWLPSLNPCVHYDLSLKLEKSKSFGMVSKLFGYTEDFKPPPAFRISGIKWINVCQMTSKGMRSMIEYAAGMCRKARNIDNTLIKTTLKKKWRDFDWQTLQKDNVTCLWSLIGHTAQSLIHRSTQKKIEDCISSIFDKTIFISLWSSTQWLEKSTAKERNEKWLRLASNPEHLLLQSKDFLDHATIDDYKRLLLFLGREIPDNNTINELKDANRFIKQLKYRVWVPIEIEGRSKSTTWIKEIANGWATVKDIKDTKNIVEWFSDIPIYAGYSRPYIDNIPLETPVLLKNKDDKLQWWSFMSYAHLHFDINDLPETYVIGEAHHFSQDDWVRLSSKHKPLAVFGRKDILGIHTRGQVFFNICKKKNIQQMDMPICNNTETMSYEDACTIKDIPTQVFVSTKADKEACVNFPILKKMKRIWLYQPKRIATEISKRDTMLLVEESDQTEKHVYYNVMTTPWRNANIVCCYESYQRVETSIFIVTKNTKPEDIYRVRSYTSDKVIFVEKGAGVPTISYTPEFKYSLIC